MKKHILCAAEYIFCALLFTLTLLLPMGKNAPVSTTLPETTPLPKKNTVVVVDAGHGGFDGGAVGLETGVAESTLNLSVAKMVEKQLLAEGFSVIMTRQDEDALASDKNADMAARGRILMDEVVDLVVSIHMNKFSDRSISGPMVFYMEGSDAGQAFATHMVDAVCDAVDHPRRLANPGDYYMIRKGHAPAVIVECGFLSNPEEEMLLQTEAYQQKLADGIVHGIIAYANEISVEK